MVGVESILATGLNERDILGSVHSNPLLNYVRIEIRFLSEIVNYMNKID